MASAISPNALVYVPTRAQLQRRNEESEGHNDIERRFELLQEYGHSRKDTLIRVLIEDIYVSSGEFETLRHLARTYGLSIVWSDVHPNYDALLTGLEDESTDRTKAISMSSKEVPWDLESYLEAAELQKEKDCLCQRVFPVVTVAGQLRVCHLYDNAILDEDVLSETFQSHERSRTLNPHCSSCQKYGLHRLDKNVLDRQQPIDTDHIVR